MQHHHDQLTVPALNTFLDAGSLVVWVHRHDNGTLDVILDHPEADQGPSAVLAFLESVNPQALDEAMAKAHRLSESPGTVALRTLMSLVGGGDERP